MRALALCLVIAAGCNDGAATCNGSIALCQKRYDQVAFPGTHNSFATKEDKVADADQTHLVPTQLADGIRALHLEVSKYDFGEPWVCHALCQLGGVKLVDALATVRTFLDANPREMITVFIELNGVTVSDAAARFVTNGLDRFAHVQSMNMQWPTLGSLIDSGQRLVVLADHTDPSVPYFLDRWKWTWETPWETSQPWTFSCAIDRGTAGAPLYTVDHFLDDPILDIIPSPARAQLVNHDPFFAERVFACEKQANQLPNFVLVNFYEIGDVFHVVNAFNGLEPAPMDYDALPTLDLSISDAGSID